MKSMLLLLSAAMLLTAAPPISADAQAGSAGMQFDEVDRVAPGAVEPAPGNFAQDVAALASGAIPAPPVQVQAPPPQAPAAPKRNIFGVLNQASSVLGGASSVINAGGTLSTVVGIADFGARMAPVANFLGLTGTANWGGLVQQFVLPQTSPTMVPLVSGYLGAQSAYKSAFPRQQAAPDAGAPPPGAAAAPNPAGAGTLRHYSVYRNGWLRIDDASTQTAIIQKPDEGNAYVLDARSHTYTVAPLTAPAQSAAASAPGAAQAVLSETTRALGAARIAGLPATGYRTDATVTIKGATGSCKDGSYKSRRVTYIAAVDDPSGSSQTPGTTATGGCAPATNVQRTGPALPSGKLLVYNANTLDRDDGTGPQTITMIEERGNIAPLTSADAALFAIPAGYTKK